MIISDPANTFILLVVEEISSSIVFESMELCAGSFFKTEIPLSFNPLPWTTNFFKTRMHFEKLFSDNKMRTMHLQVAKAVPQGWVSQGGQKWQFQGFPR